MRFDPDAVPDYARISNEWQRHHERYKRHVAQHGLICQACGGAGVEHYTSYGEPPENCGWCETTGKVTRWMRGFWLCYMRSLKGKAA